MNNSVDQASTSILGMEARSILRSIETEHSKLRQSSHTAPSDLHYFTARFNYYRLCLLRLEAEERRVLEKTLSLFRAEIFDRESGSSAIDSKQSSPPPFLTPVASHVPKPGPTSPLEEAKATSRQNLVEDALEEEVKSAGSGEGVDSNFKQKLVSELSLVNIALAAEASNDRNKVCSEAIERVLLLIKSEL